MDTRYTRDEDGRITYFNCPVQLKFLDINYDDGRSDSVHYIGGIGYLDEIICGCCGGLESLDDLYEFAPEGVDPIIVYADWLNLDEEIACD